MANRISPTESLRGLALSAVVLASLAGTAVAQSGGSTVQPDPAKAATQPEQTSKDANVQQVQKQVDSETGAQASDKQADVREDALEALQKAQHALVALDKGNADEALASLEQAIGKLRVILAISPDLALAPVGVEVTELDVLADPDAVRQAIENVQVMLRKGRVQEARHMLSMLGSEVVIRETSLPLATFPDELAGIAPLISKGSLDKARTELAQALSTMVVIDHVVPLPLLRADFLLGYASDLAAVSSRTDEQNQELQAVLDTVEDQIEMARLLGYGTDEDYKEITKELKIVRKQARSGESTEGFADRIRSKIASIRKTIFK